MGKWRASLPVQGSNTRTTASKCTQTELEVDPNFLTSSTTLVTVTSSCSSASVSAFSSSLAQRGGDGFLFSAGPSEIT